MLKKIIKLLSRSKYSYWAKTQLGNFYLLRGKPLLARKAFIECRDDWESDQENIAHADCLYEIESLNKDIIHSDRYEQVSRIIQNNAIKGDLYE